MRRVTELDLMRLLHGEQGELPEEEARELRARLRREPELAALYQRLERSWNGLELPPPHPVPPGFPNRVMARVRQSAAAGISWSAAPTWVRAVAAAALVTGLTVGAGVGRIWPGPPVDAAQETAPAIAGEEPEEVGLDDDMSLADSYWETVDAVTAGEPEGDAAP
jgi:anti-sigma factor RsiW